MRPPFLSLAPACTVLAAGRVLAALIGLAAVSVLAGCSSTPAPSAAQTRPITGPSGADLSGTGPSGADLSGTVTHSLPGCTTAVQAAQALPGAAVTLAAIRGPSSVPADPFDVVVTANGRWAFVSLTGLADIAVYRIGPGRMPVLEHLISVSGITPIGEALTPGDRYLVVADDGGGADVMSVAAAEDGSGAAVLGRMDNAAGQGAITVSVSADGRYVFVPLEDSGGIAVYNLQRAIAGGFGQAGYVGTIPTALAPTDVAVAPDGRWLYATSEDANQHSEVGTLEVISLTKAENDPAASVVASVAAACNPVRVITSPGGSVVWVTARASNALLAFSAARLTTDPRHALLAAVPVGEAPVDLAFADGGTRLVVADSDRFNVLGASASIAVVDAADALAGRPALLGYLPAGEFPRQVTAEPGGRLVLVTNYNSSQLEAIDMADLP
jgi:DNA-binding beta-propeller fold protein YncE